MRVLLAVLLLFANALPGPGQGTADSTRAPKWAARAQFAGMQGLVSTGLLWTVPDGRLQIGALYGHSPDRHSGTDFHGAILRATGAWFPVHKQQCGKWSMSPTVSLSAVMELGGISFFRLPDRYPDDYYGPQALHGLLSIGGRLGHPVRGGRLALTAEAVTLDTYLWYGIIQRQIKFKGMWSMALGVEYHF
ncbi:MAG: hypothetical protein JNL43_08275 [Flavobacteriales bacterium]|nr:hypothetical protein [Flavobacteriales bacterium]